MQTPLGLLFNQTHLGFVVHDELETYNDVGPDTGEDHVQLVIFELVEEFTVDNDFVATDKSIENSDIFLPVIKHQFFYIADY